MKKYILALAPSAMFLFPVLVYAQDPLLPLITRFGLWVNAATPVLAALALLVFFWGLVKFIAAAGDEEKRKEGKKFMGWSIIALFVVFAIWGLVYFISDALNIGTGGNIISPCVAGVPGCTVLGGL